MLKLDAEDSDGDDIDKPPPTAQQDKQAQKQNAQASENNTPPANAKPPAKAADWNSAFLKSLNNANDAPVEVSEDSILLL